MYYIMFNMSKFSFKALYKTVNLVSDIIIKI